MSERVTLSIDAMGGDNAPEMVVEGIAIAAEWLPDVDFLLFGKEALLAPILQRTPHIKNRCQIRHTDDVVSNDEKAGIALRSGRNSSMRLAINAVHTDEAVGVISAGNTGALMAMAKFVFKTLPGVSRPAIATCFPTQTGSTVMLDLGANVDCGADNLVQFAVMGEVFARNVLHIESPSVGILNIGAEVLKGNEAVKEAAEILKNSSLPLNYYGFVEGTDIGLGTVDVIVTDGFTGNVALKTAEGIAKMFGYYLKKSLTSSTITKIGALIAKPALNKFKDQFDPRRYNGAMFLGLNGICVKSHGGTDALGFAHAVKVAFELTSSGVNDNIKADFAKMQNEARNSSGDTAVHGSGEKVSQSK